MASDPLWIGAGKGTSVGTATIEADDDLFTIASHGLNDGDAVSVDTLTGGASGVLTVGAVYFVVSAATNTFGVSLNLHGPLVAFSSDGGADVYRWVPQYHAPELRRAQAMFLYPGVADEFGARSGVRPHPQAPVTVAGTTWIVHDLVATVYPGLTSQSGPYVVQHPEESDSLDPADGSNPRVDALDLQIQDDLEDASGFRRARVVYTAGTPAGSPSAPAVAANSLRLATISVPAGGSPSPSVASLAQWTVGLGGILPVRDSTERDTTITAGRFHGMFVYRQDIDQLMVWDGSAWRGIGTPDPPRVASGTVTVTPNTTQTPAVYAGTVHVGTQGVTFPAGLFSNAPRVVTAARTGSTWLILNTGSDNVTTSGCDITLAAGNNTARSIDWVAVQTLDDQGF